MMGYDDRPMNLEFAGRCLPMSLYERWYKDLSSRRNPPTELQFMDFVAQWDRVRRNEGHVPAKGLRPPPSKHTQRSTASSLYRWHLSHRSHSKA